MSMVSRSNPGFCSERDSAGFTLIEMLVVLSIMALMLALSLPYATSTERPLLQGVVDSIVLELRVLRSEAIRSHISTAMSSISNGYKLEPSEKTRVFQNRTIFSIKSANDNLRQARADKITFFPDGGSNGGQIEIKQGQLVMQIVVRGSDGKIRANEQ